jgi:hypothetical protein
LRIPNAAAWQRGLVPGGPLLSAAKRESLTPGAGGRVTRCLLVVGIPRQLQARVTMTPAAESAG